MIYRAIKRIDFYGKEPEFYYKTNSNKTTWVGRIFTILYLGIYIAFFIYKIERMIRRKDVTFYDTNSNGGELPSIHLNKELFYGAFAFADPRTDIPFLDERLYTISGKYIIQKRENEQLKIIEKNITFKKCELSDFGQNYQNIIAKKNISQMLCPINVDFVLEGYYTMEKFSYVKLNYQRCVNTTENNNHCYPNEIIDQHLAITKIYTKLQDIELTPQDHDNPVQYLEREITGTSFKGLQPQISVEMKIVMIETDNNLIGFEGLSNLKIEKYLKYDSAQITATPITSLVSQDDAKINLNEIKIQLASNILYQKRTYVQLIDVLGDVGGLMEMVNMIFTGFCSFIVNILYNNSLVNNLFNFDINKKMVIFKNNNKDKNIDIDINEEMSPKNKSKNKLNFLKKKANIKIHIKKNFLTPQSNRPLFERINKSSRMKFNYLDEDKKNNNYINYANTIIEDNNNKNGKEVTYNKFQSSYSDGNLENRKNIVKKIRINKLFIYFFFCFLKSKENINNLLFCEGMKLIIEQLDIFNVFRQLYKLSKQELILSEDDIKAQMTDECKQKLERITNTNLVT